jgi:hypothetical protein
MCSECEWLESRESEHQIRHLCDCGNFKWDSTSLIEKDEKTGSPLGKLYRCTKCDALRLVSHLLH